MLGGNLLATGAAAMAMIPEDSPFAEGGRAPAFVGLEAGAQTAAAVGYAATGRRASGASRASARVAAFEHFAFVPGNKFPIYGGMFVLALGRAVVADINDQRFLAQL